MAKSNSSLQPWWLVAENDDEKKLFRALARHEKASRSTDGLAKESKLSTKRVEEIIDKYIKSGMITSVNTKDGTMLWQYWERAEPKDKEQSIGDANKTKRVKDANNP